MAACLAGRRVLIIEDETMVAMMIEDVLAELGCTYTGPFGSIDAAMRAIEIESFDIALLDINLNGETSYPIARHLDRIGTPFVFISGYEKPDNAEWRYLYITKPFKIGGLEAAMVRALSRAGVQA
jgi:DNA-binding response OmpR family regulator